MKKQFAHHLKSRNLVSIRRERIDDNQIQAFILAASRKLVALQYVADFQLDGLMVLRVADISEMRRTRTDEFQQGLLAEEGVLKKVPFGKQFDLDNWGSVLRQFAAKYPLMILECEAQEEKLFAIGRVAEAGVRDVSFECFSGTGKWSEEPASYRYSDLASCQVDNAYINAYRRHFERVGQS